MGLPVANEGNKRLEAEVLFYEAWQQTSTMNPWLHSTYVATVKGTRSMVCWTRVRCIRVLPFVLW